MGHTQKKGGLLPLYGMDLLGVALGVLLSPAYTIITCGKARRATTRPAHSREHERPRKLDSLFHVSPPIATISPSYSIKSVELMGAKD